MEPLIAQQAQQAQQLIAQQAQLAIQFERLLQIGGHAPVMPLHHLKQENDDTLAI